jgi:hypothetical protein
MLAAVSMTSLSHRSAYCSNVNRRAALAPTAQPRVTAIQSAASGSVANVAEYFWPSTISRAR